MKKGLIGYTGFVGGNLLHQTHFDYLFNSRNIGEIGKYEVDLLICAAPSAVKWKANQDPEGDQKMIQELMDHLKKAKARQVIHLSTVDVYKNPNNVDEKTPIGLDGLHAYGKNRFALENFFRKNFAKTLIIHLPALFGEGLKKNFIYDLLHQNCLNLTHRDSQFQFYYLNNLWKDLQIALKANLSLLNITSEPIKTKKIADRFFPKLKYNTITEKGPVTYNMRSIHARLFGGQNGYLYSKTQIIKELKGFISSYQKEKQT